MLFCVALLNGESVHAVDSDGDGLDDLKERNPARTIAAGDNHTCALDDNGVQCWGANWDGQTTVPTDLLFGHLPYTGTDPLNPDSNGDWVLDGSDAFPLDATESADTDSDGTGNNADTDDDGDSVLDVNDTYPLISVAGLTDTDADGAPNTCDSDCLTAGMTADTDDDGDSVLDVNDTYPLISVAGLTDTDADGAPNDCDSDCVALGMGADTDDDNDGVLDVDDAYSLISVGELTDTDADGAPNDCDSDCVALGMGADTDDDNDGVEDSIDAFPLDASETLDTDGDSIGNNADTDDDDDGIADGADLFLLDASEFGDADGDGIGNHADTDDDNDGVSDPDDAFPHDSSYASDLDSDDLPDEWEELYGLDINDPKNAYYDPDQDGYLNWEEFLSGSDPTVSERAAQVLYADKPATLVSGHSGRLTMRYTTADLNPNLSGIGIRVHYNSSYVNTVTLENVFDTELIGINDPQDDAFDFDGDSETDQYITVAWAGFSGPVWPGEVPIDLFDVVIDSKAEIEALDTYPIRFSVADTSEGYNLSAESVYNPVILASLDIDGEGEANALTDGLLIIRRLFGFSGDSLISGAVSSSATYTDPTDIAERIDAFIEGLDVDGDGETNALTDGLLIIRRLFGFSGDSLISGAVSSTATRSDPDEIADYIDSNSGSGNSSDTPDTPDASISTEVGHPSFLSPHAKPILISGDFVYVTNTPADTLDVIDRSSRAIVTRINVGIDPVALAVRPDGREVWVSNHVSDTVSVVDTAPGSSSFHQVIATIQDVDDQLATRFDEPVGIAFASNEKAYVALSTLNEVAIIDATLYAIVSRLNIRAQDPRALTVQGNWLYVIPFESNNQTQLSGCTPFVPSDICTFDALEHVFTNNNVLSLNYDADIIRNPALPDRDLFVFNTDTDELVDQINTVGTLLYDLTADSNGTVFVAQADARNDANGRAGTLKHGLPEMENRAFLNQLTRIDCADGSCSPPSRIDLEPLPPTHPAPGTALATPYGIQVSEDDALIVATAASAGKLFTLDTATGEVLGQIETGSVPRGVAIEPTGDGSAETAWVLNVVDNTVTIVDVSAPATPNVIDTIALTDPTPAVIKLGRRAFTDANASSTSTFSCESCHPDGHTDQLIWVLQTPICDVDGCTQIQPRLTMAVRGLRDTQPYHWDGIPGDPYGGNNTASINTPTDPTCDIDDPVTCTRNLADGALGGTMCDQADCPDNDEGKAGALDATDRDAMAEFLLTVPFPPSQTRPFHNELTEQAQAGFFEFNFVNDTAGRTTGAQTCGACHKMPFLVSTNTPGTGMDAPTWRGAYDRWMVTPQARLNIIDLMNLVGIDNSFPEQDIWDLAGSSDDIWEMVVQGSTGYAGGFGRQVTLSESTAGAFLTDQILDALEIQAAEHAILLQGEGILIEGDTVTPLAVYYDGQAYWLQDNSDAFTRSTLLSLAGDGRLVLTLTGRAGISAAPDHAQPALWPIEEIHAQRQVPEIPFLSDTLSLRIRGRHIEPDPQVFVNGRRVVAEVSCETGSLPNCDDETLLINLPAAPEAGGAYFLQIQNQQGLFSNDMMFFSEQNPLPPRSGNLIKSGGSFLGDPFGANWNTVEIATNSISASGGEVHVQVREASAQPWDAQISHSVMVIANQQYTLCYRARADATRIMTAYSDTNMDDWINTSGGQFEVNLTTSWQNFQHTFTIAETDLMGRVAFDFAQSAIDVHLDHVGLFEGDSCGTP